MEWLPCDVWLRVLHFVDEAERAEILSRDRRFLKDHKDRFRAALSFLDLTDGRRVYRFRGVSRRLVRCCSPLVRPA